MTEAVDLVPAMPDHEQGFAAWVSPHMPAMARVASRLAAGADRDDIVQEAWPGLPRRQRIAVDCFYFADLSIAETAAVMGS